jgi:hypothetical protein
MQHHPTPNENPRGSFFTRINAADYLQIGVLMFSLISFAIHLQDQQNEDSRKLAELQQQILEFQTVAKREHDTSYVEIMRTLEQYHQQTQTFQQNLSDRLTTQMQTLQAIEGGYSIRRK